ncbi:MAG: undecaprenyldiphospho-muramoylpentapeptide beta-N-acetylglucosaminyltransferase [Balneolaceae bacterium]
MHTAVTDISSANTRTTAATSSLRVLIAAGGTGGHVYPGIAIADALQKTDEDVSLLFAGTRNRMEWNAVPRAGYEIQSLWISGLQRRFSPANLIFPVKLGVSLLQSFLLLKKFRPDVVVSCGGFASGPVGWVAARLGIPLILQEQNSYPGVTTRLLARHAERIFTAFEGASEWLPKEKIRLTGNPIRSSFRKSTKEAGCKQFGFLMEKPVVLILGGSGGALSINQAIEQNLDTLHDKMDLQLLWQCGPRYHEPLQRRIEPGRYPNLKLMSYIEEMPDAYAAADLVVSRAGAISCSELMLTGSPSILVPSPNVAGDHQSRNAASMTEAGAARLLSDNQVREQLPEVIASLLKNPEQLQEMGKRAQGLSRPDAASEIAKQIKQIGSRQQ